MTEHSRSLTTSANSGGDDVGAVVREYRLGSQQNQATVAAALGMTQQHLSQIEKGKRPVSLEQRRRFAQVLGIAPEQLGLAARSPRSDGSGEASDAVSASRGQWRAQRNWLNQHRSQLAKLAVELYQPEHRIPGTPLISHPSWVPREPIDLRSLKFELDEGPQTTALTGREETTASVRPMRTSTQRFDSYTSAIKHLDPPNLFESRPSYRLMSADLEKRHLRFGLGAYFDKLDVSEALGHEMALACDDPVQSSAAGLAGTLPFREAIGDPFAPQQRAIIPAITTLTIRLRRYPSPPTFLLHWRDPTKVATAAGIYDVIPAGEFQPSSVALWDRRNDFDIWRNIVREYAEELLGQPEHDGTRSQPIEYESWGLYQQLEQAQLDGAITPFFLGIGLDALTLAATMLTVVVIDDDVFHEAFGDTVRFNDEGEIVGIGDGRAVDGVPFTEETIQRMLTSEPLASPGAACLALAWQHRSYLPGC